MYLRTFWLFFVLSTAVHAQNSDEPLMANKPEGSRVVRRKVDVDFGYTELTFMNGVQILLKPTGFENEEILFAGFSPGGSSIYLDEDYMSALMATSIVTESGLGNFDKIALDRKMTDNTAKLSPFIKDIYEGVSGSAAPDDLETMLQLNYLYFSSLRYDVDAFNTIISQLRNQAANMRANPLYVYKDTLYKVMTDNNPRTMTIPTESQINRIRHDNALYIFNDRFSDASDFKFVMTGNFNINSITPLLETYLGGLPSKRRVETWRDLTPQFPPGITTVNITGNPTEQSRVNIIMKGAFNWNPRERMHFAMFTEILKIRLSESMLREEGEVLIVSGKVSRHPKSQYSLEFEWDCAPDSIEKIIDILFEEARKIKANGSTAADLIKVKETLINKHENAIKGNTYWLHELLNTYRQGDKMMKPNEYKKMVNSVRSNDIRRIARSYFNETNYLRGVLMPNE